MDNRRITDPGHVWIVAEIGCNHNGDPVLARGLVEAAARCGVDAVKFQTFSADALISRIAPKAAYQKVTTGEADSQLEMTRRLELPHDDLIKLMALAGSLGLSSFSTPFDLGSIDFLDSTGQTVWKIPSGEITNLPYLERIGDICARDPEKSIILSTGMAVIPEIRTCLDVLKGRGVEDRQLTVLHCNTEYPTPDEDVNLLAISALHEAFPGIGIGFSDHSVGSVAAAGAVLLGITMIEKHFTLDKDLPGPDHKASATPEELSDLVRAVRRMEVMKGEKIKRVTDSERGNIIVARKSIVAACDIRKGEKLTEDNITCKRPGNGISPMRWRDVLGQTAETDFAADELIHVTGIPEQEV